MKLSIIDQSPVSEGFSAADALRHTIDLARHADRLGYSRYWIAEHHASEMLASPAPEVLISRVAAETRSIRVGSGGVMLPHYSPLKVAEVFRMLHALYPDRIDLGLGRAPGAAPLETFALRRERSEAPMPDDFPRQLVELIAFLERSFGADHPFSRITVSPDMPGGPELWLLGSSMWSADAAAQLGLPYAFAHFINQRPTRDALEHYRARFRPSARLKSPHAILALGAICAGTDADAQHLASGIRLIGRLFQMGVRVGPVPTPDRALRELATLPETPHREPSEFPRYFIGAPDQLRDQLDQVAGQLNVDELMIVTITHDHRARVRSYELLAQAFELAPRPAASSTRNEVNR